MITTTKAWKCACGYYGANFSMQESKMDYLFFLMHYEKNVVSFIEKGHTPEKCEAN
jgi:hypothetical protein